MTDTADRIKEAMQEHSLPIVIAKLGAEIIRLDQRVTELEAKDTPA